MIKCFGLHFLLEVMNVTVSMKAAAEKGTLAIVKIGINPTKMRATFLFRFFFENIFSQSFSTI